MEILDYIEAYWPRIVRNVSADEGTLIGLPRPYMAPAEDPIFQEMFYWDSYFTAVGLSGTPREQLVVDTAENMVAMLRRFGMIPVFPFTQPAATFDCHVSPCLRNEGGSWRC